MSDEPINVANELAAANPRFAIDLSNVNLPLEMQMRTIALTIAQRHYGDTCVKEGAMYNALKMDNRPPEPLSLDHVIKAAIVFERYLWGEWSKGLAENAINATMTQAADVLEEVMREKGMSPDEPTRPPSGDVS